MFLRNFYVNEMYRTFDAGYTQVDELLVQDESCKVTNLNGSNTFCPRPFIQTIIPRFGVDTLPSDDGTSNTQFVFISDDSVTFNDTTCTVISDVTASLNGNVVSAYDESSNSYTIAATYSVSNGSSSEISLNGFAIISWTGYRQFTSDSKNIPILVYKEVFDTPQVIAGNGTITFEMVFTYKMPSNYEPTPAE